MIYLLPLTISFGLSIIFTPLIRKVALKMNIIDRPGPRKIQKKPIPLLGGLAIFLAFAFSTLIFWQLGYVQDLKIPASYIYAILAGGIILMIGGFIDDFRRLKPIQQIIWPVMAIIVVLSAGIKIQFITNPFGGVMKFSAILGTMMAFWWLLGMIYTTKLLDGLDGLVSGVTVIASIIIFIVSLYWDIPSSGTSFLALILAGSCLGFLIFNWHPAKIFLGESGSVFCGFMLGILAIISGSKIATALLIMGVPILDVVWVIISRIWQGRSPVSGDNQHLHFRLLNIGLSHRQAVLFLYVITTAFGITSLFLHSTGKLLALFILIIFTALLVLSLVLIYNKKLR